MSTHTSRSGSGGRSSPHSWWRAGSARSLPVPWPGRLCLSASASALAGFSFLLSSALTDLIAALFLPSILRAIGDLDVSVGNAFVALLAGSLATNLFLIVLQGSTAQPGAVAPSFGLFGLLPGLVGTGVSYLMLQTIVRPTATPRGHVPPIASGSGNRGDGRPRLRGCACWGANRDHRCLQPSLTLLAGRLAAPLARRTQRAPTRSRPATPNRTE